jgi:proteasome assembly chaperone (PAC2) family protein
MNLNFMSLPQPTFNVVYSSVNLPQLQSPYLICGFPGTGYVGKIAIDHLIQELMQNILPIFIRLHFLRRL